MLEFVFCARRYYVRYYTIPSRRLVICLSHVGPSTKPTLDPKLPPSSSCHHFERFDPPHCHLHCRLTAGCFISVRFRFSRTIAPPSSAASTRRLPPRLARPAPPHTRGGAPSAIGGGAPLRSYRVPLPAPCLAMFVVLTVSSSFTHRSARRRPSPLPSSSGSSSSSSSCSSLSVRISLVFYYVYF